MELFGLILEILLMGETNLQGVVHRVRDYPLVVISLMVIQKNLMELFGLILENLLMQELDIR